MANESDKIKTDDPPAGTGLKAPDERLTEIGKAVRGYVLQAKEYVMPPRAGEKAELNKLEEGVIAVTTGWQVPGLKNSEVFALPFVNKNLFRLNWTGDKEVLGDRNLQAQVSFGSSHPTLNQFSLTKERMLHGSTHTFEEYGLLDQRIPKGSSYLGKASPKAPLLDNLSVGVGNAGGIGMRGKASDGPVSWDLQVAERSDFSALPLPGITAPTKMLTVTHTGSLDLTEGKGKSKYAVGATVFTDVTGPGIQGKISKPGFDVTGQLQHRQDALTTNLTAEAMHVGDNLGSMRRAALEVSHKLKSGLVPYAEVSTTKASGSIIPDGMIQGRSSDAKLGMAYTVMKENSDSRAVDFYCEVADGSKVKPSVTCGFTTGVVGANIIQTGKRK